MSLQGAVGGETVRPFYTRRGKGGKLVRGDQITGGDWGAVVRGGVAAELGAEVLGAAAEPQEVPLVHVLPCHLREDVVDRLRRVGGWGGVRGAENST